MFVANLLVGLIRQRHQRQGFGLGVQRMHRLQIVQHDVERRAAQRKRAADLQLDAALIGVGQNQHLAVPRSQDAAGRQRGISGSKLRCDSTMRRGIRPGGR